MRIVLVLVPYPRQPRITVTENELMRREKRLVNIENPLQSHRTLAPLAPLAPS
jgi:hypothetical protein